MCFKFDLFDSGIDSFVSTMVKRLWQHRKHMSSRILPSYKNMTLYGKAGHIKTAYALYDCVKQHHFTSLPARHLAFVLDPGELRDPTLAFHLSKEGWGSPFREVSPKPYRVFKGPEASIYFLSEISQGTFYLRARKSHTSIEGKKILLEVLFNKQPILKASLENYWEWFEAEIPKAALKRFWHEIVFRNTHQKQEVRLTTLKSEIRIGCVLIEHSF
jgi:hypothetical protein